MLVVSVSTVRLCLGVFPLLQMAPSRKGLQNKTVSKSAHWLSYRHRKSNHLWQRWLQPLRGASAGDLRTSQPRAEQVTSLLAPGSYS